MKKRRSANEAQIALTFEYHERLADIVRDLEALDNILPHEISRTGCLMDSKRQGNEIAIIEYRKKELMSYIQTICRDHVVWSKKLLDRGWRASISLKKRGNQ